MNKSLILVVEDDTSVRNLITTTLKTHEYRYLTAPDGQSAILETSSHNPDIVLLDLGLPDMDGVEIIKKIRTWSNMPIIVISARSEDTDKIDALDAGADDYLTKPFYPSELIARIEAVLRRTHAPLPSSQAISFDGLQLDPISHRATANQVLLDLGPTEFRLLKFFLQHPERVYSLEALLSYVWERGLYVEERTVDVHILRLRKALMPFGYDHYVQTVRGVGYRFSPYPQLMLQQSESM